MDKVITTLTEIVIIKIREELHPSKIIEKEFPETAKLLANPEINEKIVSVVDEFFKPITPKWEE